MSNHGLWHSDSEVPLSPTSENRSDSPKLKIPAHLKQMPLSPTPEDETDEPTLKRIPAIPKRLPMTPIPEFIEEVSDLPTLRRIPAVPRQTSFLLPPEEVSPKEIPPEEVSEGEDAPDQQSDQHAALPQQLPRKHTLRTVVIVFLLLLLAGGIAGAVLIFSQKVTWAQLTGQLTFFASSKFLLGLCIALAIAFTVAFNIISRISLSTTKYESAYTIWWQVFCALLAPLFLPFDGFSISISPHVLPLFALSVVLWALADAFLFSAFKHEEASILSAIFPLNFVFTFVVSVIFFHSAIKATIIAGFLIIMLASLLIGVFHMRLQFSKGMAYGFLYSLFLGVALGFNSEVVKSFSIPPYMVAAFLFPALANLLIFLRPKRAELRYELRVQWKKILLNAAVMDASFFCLLRAFQLGNVPQVVAFSASSTLLTTLAGVVILKEDKHVAFKLLAAGLATLGLVLLQR